MVNRLQFNRATYFKKQGLMMAGFFTLSLFIDLFILWNLTIGLPENVVSKTEAYLFWRIACYFLIIINFLLLKVWNVTLFFSKLTKWQSGYIEIHADKVIHCVEKSEISKSKVILMRGYVPNPSKDRYDFVMKYEIYQVYKLSKTIPGVLKIVGNIEMDCLDEYYGLETGNEDLIRRYVSNHSIPPYYEGMDIIQLKLETMATKQSAIIKE